MPNAGIRDRVLGCVVGASIGDAIGGAFEFQDADFIGQRIGSDWIDDMHPYEGIEPSPHGIWEIDPSAGTGTDDTRYDHIFIETTLGKGKEMTSRDLAEAFIQRYETPGKYYPGNGELARQQFADWHGVCCGHLGKECPLHPGVPSQVLAHNSMGMDFPTLIGMLVLASAGLLHIGCPEEAYRRAYLLDFMDVGYARESVAVFAVLVSMLAAGADIKSTIEEATRINPYGLGGPFGGSTVLEKLPRAVTLANNSKDDRDLVMNLAHAFAGSHPFDPVELLTVAVASLYFTKGDPRRSILIAANNRIVDEDGKLIRFRDNDCSAYFAGALAGAHCGLSGLPSEWANKVVDSNRRLYDIDIIDNAEKLYAMVTET